MFETQLQFWQILAASGVIGLGAFIQSGTGFGMGLLSVPLLALIDPGFIPGPLLLAALLLNIIMAIQNRNGIVTNQVKHMATGVVIGTAFAFLLLSMLQGQKMGVLFGVTILAAVIISCSGVRISIIKPTLWCAGFLCGLMGTICGMGGPPLILLYQNQPGLQVRGNLAVIFIFAALFALAALNGSGHFGQQEAIMTAILAPGIIAGTIIAPPFKRYLDRVNLRPFLLCLSCTGAIALIARDLI